jgi:hypothetical protein
MCIISLFSCSVTRHLESHESILVKNKIKIDNSKIEIDDMMNYVRQKPNRKTLGFLFHLRVHNTFLKSERKVGSWIRETIGEEPALYDSSLNARTVQQFHIYLREQGYYSPEITVHPKTRGLHKKKTRVNYRIRSGEPYIIQTVLYEVPDTNISAIIAKSSQRAHVSEGKLFSVHALLEERKRLTNIIHNHGYYSFTENDIYFSADTSRGDLSVAITLGVLPNRKTENEMYEQYKIRNTIIYADYQPSLTLSQLQTYVYDPYIVVAYQDYLYVSPKVIARANYIKNGELYNASRIRRTQRQLAQNQLFSLVNVSFQETQETDSAYVYIDCVIRITRATQQGFTVELEGNNTAGDWGAKSNLTYSHKNLFKGAEYLQIKLTGMLEHNQSIATEDSRFFNTHELGAEMKLDIPRFLSPIIPDQFDLSFKPVTTIRVAYNHMQNVFFTRPTSGFAFGYTWFGNNFLTHYFNPIEVSYIRYYNESKRFIEFKDSRDYYKFSYEDYMIYSLNYSLVFYNRNPQVLKHYKYFRLFFESAGNGMYATQHFLSNSNSVDVPYETFNVVFAQYLKLELDYRFYYVMNRKTSVVSRVFGGVVAPYLNSEWVPNVKRYFVGGANSVRGWSARSLGPGSYIDSVSSFQYNLGDIKLDIRNCLNFII